MTKDQLDVALTRDSSNYADYFISRNGEVVKGFYVWRLMFPFYLRGDGTWGGHDPQPFSSKEEAIQSLSLFPYQGDANP